MFFLPSQRGQRVHNGTIVKLDHITAYCTSKGALDHLTWMMALELGADGIRVNAVNLTVVMMTDLGRDAWDGPANKGKGGTIVIVAMSPPPPPSTPPPSSPFVGNHAAAARSVARMLLSL